MDLASELAKIIKGDVDATDETREFYSHDASLFELKPQVVVFPKDGEDVQAPGEIVGVHAALQVL